MFTHHLTEFCLELRVGISLSLHGLSIAFFLDCLQERRGSDKGSA